MASHLDDSSQLLIRCPSCGQRFKVGPELRGRTVECGTCEHRFKISDEVIVRGTKFYPGERETGYSNRFQRVPIAVPPPENLQTIQYADLVASASFEPVSPPRLIAGAAGVGLAVMGLVLLYFGNRPGGMLEGVPMANRVALGLFIAIVSGCLLIFANPRTRKRAVASATAFFLLLVGIPLSQPDPPPVVIEPVAPYQPPKEERNLSADERKLEELREEIGTEVLETQIERLREEGSDKQAYGVWIHDLGRDKAFLIWEHLINEFNADSRSHAYPRGKNDYLMVLSGLEMGITTLARRLESVGEVVAIHQELQVIEIIADQEIFQRGEAGKLGDPANPAFYELNKRELESIDLNRVRDAVVRLASAEPKQYRSDISRRLVSLLRLDGVQFKEQVCQAMLVWNDPSADAGPVVEELVQKLAASGSEINLALAELAAREKRLEVLPVFYREWLRDFNRWERILEIYGQPVETLFLKEFPEMDIAAQKSAVVILGRVGGAPSLELFRSIEANADREMRVRIEHAGRAIQNRLSKRQADQ